MKKVGFLLLSLVMACTGAMAQEEIRFDITGFEGLDWDWMYTGNSVVYSQIEWSDFAGDAPLREGEQMLAVEYDNEVGGTWQGVNLSFPEPVNLTGATEIHMWVFVVPERTVGNFEIRLDLPDGTGLGTRGISSDRWGEWVELVWKMDRVTSADRISSVGSFGGFISAGDPPADSGLVANAGFCYIDEIFALRPEGTPAEYDELVLWGFNEEDPATGEPIGWTVENGSGIALGLGDVEPTEGSNYGEFSLGTNYTSNVKSTNALSLYDKWPSVIEIMVDARVAQDISGGWVNFQLILQSNANGWDSYGEMGIASAKDTWKTLLWSVDMSKHADAFNPDVEDRWFQLLFTTNQDAQDTGKFVYIDNLRIVVPKQESDIPDWTLF